MYGTQCTIDPSIELTLIGNIVPNAMLLCIEASVAIISICLPRILNMLRKGFVHLSSHSRGSTPTRGFDGPAAQRLGRLGIPMEVHRPTEEGKPINLGGGLSMVVTMH